jgi:hypothetical protein
MKRSFAALVVAGAVLSIIVGCRTTRDSKAERPEPAPPMQPTVVAYIDSDAFDGLFETALVNKDPIIIIRTDREKPDWEGRLNAWIAAWNMGSKIEGRTTRGQIPAQINAEFLREFRGLVGDVVNRAEELAKASSAWWQEERTRSRRVALLRPYNLRFHMSEDKKINLIFFHGDYAHKYQEFMTTMTGTQEGAWTRTYECSVCDKFQPVSRSRQLPKATE